MDKKEHRLEGKTLAFLETQYGQIQQIQSGINGALALVLAQEGLTGSWSIDWPNRRLVSQDPPRELQQLETGSEHELARNGRG